ncbi:hypothetical protein P872_01205 [Rhodonellum psychrophilum GCM71 = DSM 17998]|uniref:Uncharacterized protein n=2 Tax=Rhodonellum TaxID=336827 RepID=U5C4S2_9BACT|nr:MULTISPECIES: hypothetical protein [Rhodonellum]ERM83906.1 hypothetical protein P872_01205 [Rhodonellum psychrophilum GCM71 = DSM 17998]MDO9550893.1 hypothetical protein [Rhodonellum sp.]SDZ04741.1 hypothetical protein SAMN05444412_10527 [Rhodonellum ikkaensis]
MTIKFTKHFLEKLENLFAASDYILRYEKGSFKSGYCILNDSKIVIINRYYTLEGKINTLLEIVKELNFNPKDFVDKKNQDLLSELQQTELKL